MHSVASTKLSDLLQFKSTGETVNVHVVPSIREPRPDFAEMQRTIESGTFAKVIDENRDSAD
jgi:hypothetical protein